MCGCDGITYHDSCLMHLKGQNSLAAGACLRTAQSTLTCAFANDPACTAKGAVCGLKADTACGPVPVAGGICWVVPASCPNGGGTAKPAEVCNLGQGGPATTCVSECNAVKAQVRYGLTANCN
jgi:hypothetical protein